MHDPYIATLKFIDYNVAMTFILIIIIIIIADELNKFYTLHRNMCIDYHRY